MASFRLVGSLSAVGSDAGSTSTGAGSAASPSMPIMPAVTIAASAMYGFAQASSACGVHAHAQCGLGGVWARVEHIGRQVIKDEHDWKADTEPLQQGIFSSQSSCQLWTSAQGPDTCTWSGHFSKPCPCSGRSLLLQVSA